MTTLEGNAVIGTAARTTRWRALLGKPAAAIAVGYLLVVCAAVGAAPLLAPYDPLAQQLTHTLSIPSAQHLLGTDTLGRDVLSRLLYGGRPALLGALEASVVFLVLGVLFGLLAGYSRGVVDRVVTAVADVVFSLPAIVVILAVLAMFHNSLSAAMISAGLLASAGLIRIVRALTMSAREELFVAAARVSGLSSLRILARHVLPRLIGPIVIQVSIFFGVALVLQSGLGFLNLGVTAPAPSWGGMVGEAASAIQQFPWLLVPPGAAIGLTVLACGLLGDALRELNSERTGRGHRSVRRRRTAALPVTTASVRALGDGGSAVPAALLDVRDLRVGFGEGDHPEVVHGVSFTVQEGELVGLVGESGSGKTVTALSLLGLLPGTARVTARQMFFDERDLRNAGQREFREIRGRGIALVSQEPMVALDPSFTIGHQLGEVLKVTRPGPRRERRQWAAELLADVRLPNPRDVMNSYPHQLSGGMAQRVAIAMALAGRPKLLVADEPTTALDVTVQAEILDLLKGLRDEHRMAVLLITHDLAVVAEFCERVLVMEEGSLVEDKDTVSLFELPSHPYTRSLLAATPSLIDLAAHDSGADSTSPTGVR